MYKIREQLSRKLASWRIIGDARVQQVRSNGRWSIQVVFWLELYLCATPFRRVNSRCWYWCTMSPFVFLFGVDRVLCTSSACIYASI